jgi:hypothetical protein
VRGTEPKLTCIKQAMSMCLWTIFRITFSNSLRVVDKRLIWRKFWGNFGSLPSFVDFMALASFQDLGKWDSRRQWLNKCVRCTSGLHGRCLRHSFGIPSSPQAFLNFNYFTNFCMSQGLTFSNGVSSTDASRTWTLASSRLSWFPSHRSWDVNWFSWSIPFHKGLMCDLTVLYFCSPPFL